jgi:hypothetical protein
VSSMRKEVIGLIKENKTWERTRIWSGCVNIHAKAKGKYIKNKLKKGN